jgi:hypothetical protein
MAYDPNGEWGLRRRVRIFFELTQSYAATASQLGVSESLIVSFLTDPDYIPSPEDQAIIIGNLANVIPIDAWTHEREMIGGNRVVFVEAALFDAEMIAGLAAPPGATSFLWHFNGDNNSDPSAEGTLKSSPSFGYPEHDPLTIANDLVGTDYDLLRTLVWFCHAP